VVYLTKETIILSASYFLGFPQYHPPQNQYPSAGNQNQYPPVGNQSQPYQHDQYKYNIMYQHQPQMPAHQNQGYPAIQNPNYSPPYSQPGYGHIIQHQPSAYQPSPQVVAGKLLHN